MGTLAQIGQGLLFAMIYLMIWNSGPSRMLVRLIAWERTHPSKFRRIVQPVSWAYGIGGGMMISTVIVMNFKVIFGW